MSILGGCYMYKNKNIDGSLNLSGKKIMELRTSLKPYVSQRELADKLQVKGLDLDKNAIQKIECGKRFVTDIELKFFAEFFNVNADYILGLTNN